MLKSIFSKKCQYNCEFLKNNYQMQSIKCNENFQSVKLKEMFIPKEEN